MIAGSARVLTDGEVVTAVATEVPPLSAGWCKVHGWGTWNCYRVGNCRFTDDDAMELLERYAIEAEEMTRAEIDSHYACLMFNESARMDRLLNDTFGLVRPTIGFLQADLQRLREEQGPLED